MALLKRGGKLLKKNGELIKGECGCCGGDPCQPGEPGLQCAAAGKTGMGNDLPVAYPMPPNFRGKIEFDFTVLRGTVTFLITAGAAVNRVELVAPPGGAPAAGKLTVCKGRNVASITVTVTTKDPGDMWQYGFSCPNVCCEPPAVRRFVARQAVPPRRNPLP